MKQNMGSRTQNDSSDECILYELLVYSEWKTDPELSKVNKNNEFVRFNVPGSSVSSVLQYFLKHDNTLDDILRLQLRQMPWQFAVGDNGKVVAVLQENLLEIRISRDEYSSVVGKAVISKDSYPQWRKLCWSPDCSMLAIAHSNGVISFHDLLGSNIFTIFPSKAYDSRNDAQNPVASIFFHPPRIKSPKWSYELIVVNYLGDLCSYFVSPTDGFQENHNFSFAQHYRNGVYAVTSHSSHNLLFVAGSTGRYEGRSSEHLGSNFGLSAWRILNDYPYYKLTMSSKEEEAILKAQRSLWNWVPSWSAYSRKSMVVKMQVSPAGRLLGCIHSCGSISLWRLPSIELCSLWELTQQPAYDVKNPQMSGFSRPKIREGELFSSCHPVDINWWSEQAVIIARFSGAVSVCSVSNLRNLLGESPEFLAGQPQVSSMCNERGFLGLECETQISSLKRSNDDLVAIPSETESSDDEDDVSLLNRSSALLQSAVYLVTDIERFQPKRKRHKLLHKTYRLLGLKSTTPEELYARKIDNEEYGDALDLARTYNLDCDLVYQRQWRNSKVSIHTIRDYLSKITKRSWVLKECVQRVPENFDAAQELLEFGLLGTNLETLVAIGEGTDKGLFVVQSSSNDALASADEETFKLGQKQREEELLSKIKSDSLSPAQQELIFYRWKLLWYLDMLHTYKKIQNKSDIYKTYNYEFYDRFRSEPVLTSTVGFAREGQWYAVKVMMTYHGNTTLRHWLPILSNFPETLNPCDYEALLPECDSEGQVFPWQQLELRPKDWCEKDIFRNALRVDAESDNSLLLLEGEQENEKFTCDSKQLTEELLSSWYSWRIHCIEKRSCIVDHALSLVKLAQARKIHGLEELYDQLLTLDSLVYDVHLENIELQTLEKMTDLEKAKLILSKSSATTFVRDVKYILQPFLTRCEKKIPGSQVLLLRGCLLDISSRGLSLPLLLFEQCRNDPNSFHVKWSDIVALAFDCLYAYPHADQLDIAAKIMQCVSDKNIRTDNSHMARIQEVENDLAAATILSKNGLPKPLAFIRDCKAHPTSVQQLMLRLSRSVARQVPPPTKVQWDELLNDMLALHAKVFKCINLQVVYEMYAETLLSSGTGANIRMASDILEVQRSGQNYKRVPFDRSVQLVLQVAREYFDSSGSLVDPAMELAKACLHLIVDEDESVQENLDLIASLQLLNDFGLSMLPLQVRQCSDRLKLVESCVKKKPLAYRSWHRLLQLAHKLRVARSDPHLREGLILALVAETALQEKDLSFCADMCKRLMENGFPGGWEVVRNLGLCSEFTDLKLRHSLLGFVLLHCPSDSIEPLIRARCCLESEILHAEINSQVDPNFVDDEEFSDALTSPGTPQKEFVPVTLGKAVERSTEAIKQTTYNLVHNISSKDFWKTSFSWGKDINSSPIEEETFSPFSLQGLPAFYASISPDCHFSNLDIRYDRFAQPDIQDRSLKMCRSLLRTILLEQSAGDEIGKVNPDVLCELGMRLLPEDSALGICHLLAVRDVDRVEQVFRGLPCTSISLQLACYCFALKGWLAVHCGNKARIKDTFRHPPLMLVQYMAGLAAGLQPPPDWAAALLRLHHQLADYVEGQQLQACGCGVDLKLFSSDPQYRRESILGLALSVKPEQFELAVNLGARHGVSVGEICSMHVNALLLAPEEELKFTSLLERLKDPSLLKRLCSEPNIVCERLTQYVYPSLSGTDHLRLIEYYNIINNIAKLFITNHLCAKDHVKLIKKVRSISSAIDYKELVSKSKPILDVLRPVLQQDNVGVVAKLVQSMPEVLQDGTQPSAVYGVWALHSFLKVFESGDYVDNEKCLNQLENVRDIFNKMDSGDILNFAQGSCFSEIVQDNLSHECRCNLLNKLQEYCLSRSEKSASNLKTQWEQTSNTLAKWQEHLEIFNLPQAEQLRLKCDSIIDKLLKKIERSCGESPALLLALQEAVESSVSVATLKHLLQLLAPPVSNLPHLLEKLLTLAVSELRTPSGSNSQHLLCAVIRRLTELVTQPNGPSEVVNPSVWRQLEQLCIDGQLPPDVQLQVLNLLQRVQSMSGDSENSQTLGPQRLLLHHTQAAVALAWPDTHPDVNDNDLATDTNRRHLFSNLLSKTNTWEQMLTLVQLLKRWPPFEPLNGRHFEDGPWIKCVDKLLNFERVSVEDMENTLLDIFQSTSFSEESLQEVVKRSEGLTELSPLVLVCLLTDNSNLHHLASSLVLKYYHVGVTPLSNLVCRQLLHRGLTASVVSCRAYPQLIDLLLNEHLGVAEGNSSPPIPEVSMVCKQLVNAGCLAEAGMLHLRSMGAPAPLINFSTALLLAQHWSSEEE